MFESVSDPANISVESLWDMQATRYARIAASTIMFYDYLITLNYEIELFWKMKRSFVTILFFLNRYFIISVTFFKLYARFSPSITDSMYVPFAIYLLNYGQLSPRTFRLLLSLSQLLEFLPGKTMDNADRNIARPRYPNNPPRIIERYLLTSTIHGHSAILQVRVYALYSLNRKLLAFMLVCYASSSAVAAWIIGSNLKSARAIALAIPGGKTCIHPGASSSGYTIWIPVLLFDFILFSLVSARGIADYRFHGASIFRGGKSLLGILIRDSVFYFLVLVIAYLVTLLIWLLGPATIDEAAAIFVTTLSSALASRLLFNIREANNVNTIHLGTH